MISNPKHGWCSFNLGDFHGTPSYLTDVPVDLLVAFIDYKTKGQGMAWFDEEGSEFSLVITPYSLFVIEEKESPVLHDFSEMRIDELIKEVIADIEFDLIRWCEFITDDDREKILIHRDDIRQKLAKLRELM